MRPPYPVKLLYSARPYAHLLPHLSEMACGADHRPAYRRLEPESWILYYEHYLLL